MAMNDISSSEITPERLFRSRRQFMRSAAALAGGAALLSACGIEAGPAASSQPNCGGSSAAGPGSGQTDELGDKLTDYASVIGYNNYYEFTTDKEGVASLAKNFKTTPWTVAVGGMVNKPQTFAIEDLLKQFPQEERI